MESRPSFLPPSPQTTLVILLGASEWPRASDLLDASPAFANSAHALKEYFLGVKGFNLPKDNLLVMPTMDDSADDLDATISQFLDKHIEEREKSDDIVRDVLVYYIGHGSLSEGNTDFSLAVRRTRKKNLKGSSYDIGSLAQTLRESARFQRRLLILDCCFAAATVKGFQGASLENAVTAKTIEAFSERDRGEGDPSKGTSLLCSSRNTARSRILPDETFTMFTQAFLHALHTGDPYQNQNLSLTTVHRLTTDFLLRTYKDAAPRPEVHSPDQSEGDVASIPFFPNPAKVERLGSVHPLFSNTIEHTQEPVSNPLKITLQRKVEEQWWPVVLEHRMGDTALEVRSEGVIALDLLALSYVITPRDYGVMLGQALFQGEIRVAFLHACDQSEDRLSVQLFIEAPELRALRWERLCAPLDGEWQFLALDQRTPLSIAVPSEAKRQFPYLKREDLRALVVVASPEGGERYRLSPFDVEATVSSVRSALGNIPCDVLATIEDAVGLPTLDALCKRLATMFYPLLHVVCHGRYSPAPGENVIYLATDEQQVDPVITSRLLNRFSLLRKLPHFVFLATCESASPQEEGALGGVAQRLLDQLGIPAVLAMTDMVSISTSGVLTRQFYHQLSKHGHLDVALTEACAGLAERADSPVPVLYSRLGAHSLFRVG